MVQQCALNMQAQITELHNEDKLATPIILISGFLLSLWTSCIFLVGVAPDFYRLNVLIIITVVVSHVIVSLAATKGVLQGLKKRDPVFLQPWIYTKIVEGVFLFAGSIICATDNYGRNVGLTPVGIILLMIGLYVTICVWSTYKKMQPEPINRNIVLDIPEAPPSYDSFTNQNLK